MRIHNDPLNKADRSLYQEHLHNRLPSAHADLFPVFPFYRIYSFKKLLSALIAVFFLRF